MVNDPVETTQTNDTRPQPGKGAKPLPASGFVVFGGLTSALAASSCCIAPLVLFSLGASGAWMGNLTALAPYQPIFIVVALGFLATGFFLVYRKPQMAAYAEGAICARPVSGPVVKIVLWSSTVLVVAALAFPYVVPWLLGG